MKCKNCDDDINVNELSEYASGYFCSQKCARSYSTKNDDKTETKEAFCIVCNKKIQINKRASLKTCKCDSCKEKIKHDNAKKEARYILNTENIKCDYGCKEKAKYILSNGKYCCSEYHNSCIAIRKKASQSIKKLYKKGILVGWDITKEQRTWNKDQLFGDFNEIFKENSVYNNSRIRKIVIDKELKKYECNKCGISNWNNKDIILELDHINGDNKDNRLINLRFLCPNCHSQTSTFKRKNVKKTIPDDILIENLKKCKSIRSALITSNLTGKGGNYIRAYNLIDKHNIKVGSEYIKIHKRNKENFLDIDIPV